eukprot:1008609-Rhodomonas_salina.1
MDSNDDKSSAEKGCSCCSRTGTWYIDIAIDSSIVKWFSSKKSTVFLIQYTTVRPVDSGGNFRSNRFEKKSLCLGRPSNGRTVDTRRNTAPHFIKRPCSLSPLNKPS